jgi:hypothetical protein
MKLELHHLITPKSPISDHCIEDQTLHVNIEGDISYPNHKKGKRLLTGEAVMINKSDIRERGE